MEFRVIISNQDNIIISDDIWFGNNIEDVKYWVNHAIRDLMYSTNSEEIYFSVMEV